MARRLGLPPSGHAQEYERYAEMAEDIIKQAERADKQAGSCETMYSLALQSSAASAIANRESRHAFADQPAMLKQAETRLEKLLKRSLRLDDKVKSKCLR